jgi:GrpB-like predicted nucleotidyltransferase (UPF0157 family)
MLRPKQKKWLAHLSDDNHTTIIPWDPRSPQIFEAVKNKIRDTLGENVNVKHCGATALGISGQDEIDIYVPVPPARFDQLLVLLTQTFGPPKSCYPQERARFDTDHSGKNVDVFLINQECRGWTDGVKFETYLKTHPEALEAYRQLKESGNGLSTRAYYTQKIEFINDILTQTD